MISGLKLEGRGGFCQVKRRKKHSSRRPLYVQWQVTVERPCLNGMQQGMREGERGKREDYGWKGARKQNKCLVN